MASGVKKTHSQYLSELKDIHHGKIIMLNQYTTKRNKGRYQCTICSHRWESESGNLVKKNGASTCPNCRKIERLDRLKISSIKKQSKTKNEAVQKISEVYGDMYEVLSDYENRQKKMLLKCKLHGEFKQRYDTLLMGTGCQECGNLVRIRKINEINDSKRDGYSKQFLKTVEELTEDEYIVLSEYIDVGSYVLMKHTKCGHEWDITPGNFIWNNRRCPKCNESKGESLIADILCSMSVNYSQYARFNECRNERPLPFDAHIENNILVEYDGEDHFHPIDRAGKGEEWAFENHLYRQKNDKIKNQYCIENNIPLLRIPYWEFDNIESILESALMHFNTIERSDVYDVSRFEEYLVDKNWNHDEYLSKCPKNQKESDNNVA